MFNSTKQSDNQMRLLMLNHNVAWSSGTFFRVWHIARQMVKRGHAVTVLSIAPRERWKFREEIRDGVRVVETPDWLSGRGRTGWDVWDTLQRSLFVRKEKWDIIHAFDSRPAVILPALAAQKSGTPLVLDWADWWGRGGTIEERTTGPFVKYAIGPLETYFEEAYRTRAQGTTVISAALEKRALALGVRAETILRLPHGCDVEAIQPLERNACRDALGLPRDVPIVGHLGAMNKSDATLLFAAFEQLSKRRSGCRLILLGRPYVDVPDIPTLYKTGYVSRETLLQYLGACDVMLAPLKDTIASRGRWPSKMNDYLAAGKPIAACAVGDVREYFDKYEIGIATSDVPDAFAAGIDFLLDDQARLMHMGQQSRRVAEIVLNWSLLTERLETHYRGLS